eukprot:m.27815 g.27815  ORF g.27815 m.27815 type:complete len:287 (+) comp15815_c0_seq1:61-921(+)
MSEKVPLLKEQSSAVNESEPTAPPQPFTYQQQQPQYQPQYHQQQQYMHQPQLQQQQQQMSNQQPEMHVMAINLSHGPQHMPTGDVDAHLSGNAQDWCMCGLGNSAHMFHRKNEDHMVMNKFVGCRCCPDHEHDILLLDEITGGQVRTGKSKTMCFAVCLYLPIFTFLFTTTIVTLITDIAGADDYLYSTYLIAGITVWCCIGVLWLFLMLRYFLSKTLTVQFFKQRGNLWWEFPHALGSRSVSYEFTLSTTQGEPSAQLFVDRILSMAKLARIKNGPNTSRGTHVV